MAGPPRSDDAWLKAVCLVVMGVVITMGMLALTIGAVFTDRDLTGSARAIGAAIVVVALLGGLTVTADGRGRRARRRRTDDDDDD